MNVFITENDSKILTVASRLSLPWLSLQTKPSPLTQFNEETLDFGTAHPFAFFIRDENHQIIAGCNGSVIFGSIYTDQLWVHPDHRKSSLGHKSLKIFESSSETLTQARLAKNPTSTIQLDLCEIQGFFDFQ